MNESSKTIHNALHDSQLADSENVVASQIRGRAATATPKTMASDDPFVQESSTAATTPTTPPEPKRYLCPHCGTMLETDDPIEGLQVPCPECGRDFNAKHLNSFQTISQPASTPPSPQGKNTSKSKWIICSLFFLGVLLALAIGWWFIVAGGAEHVNSILGVRLKGECVNSALVFRLGQQHSETFGGHVPPEAYSYDCDHPRQSPPPKIQTGNPLYFLCAINPTWSHYESSPGEKHVFERNDKYFVDNVKDDEWINYSVVLGAIINLGHKFRPKDMVGYNAKMADGYFNLIQKNALTRGIFFPSPVAMSDNAYDTRFCYLNEAGNPSVLEWGPKDEDWFWCHEGRKALLQYAKCLRELRQRLEEYSTKDNNHDYGDYHEVIPVTNLPQMYIGRLSSATREKAFVKYELIKGMNGHQIMETTETRSGCYQHAMTLDALDSEIEFYSRFETEESLEKAFEPLYCFLTQRKLEHEKATQSSGKQNQELTFASIGQQVATASVKLEASAESGRPVVFSVSGPGKISGNVLTFTGSGIVTLYARQWGDDHWKMASSTQYVQVVKASQKVHFSPISDQTVDASLKLSATADSGKQVVFSVLSGPGTIIDENLTFYAAGTVNVKASVPGDNMWEEASATQIVEVKSTGGLTSSEPQQHARSSAPVAKTKRQKPISGPVLPEFAPLAEALEKAKRSPTGANYKALMTAWEELPKKQKDAASKPVLWAFSAMLCAKGQADEVLKHQSLIDYPAFRDTVSDPCKTCEETGRKRIKCATCGGTGAHEVKCNICKGTGICSFCRGTGLPTSSMSGRALQCSNCGGTGKCKSCSRGIAEKPCADCKGGMRSLRCPTCNGSGRIYPADKCERIAKENIEEALRLCKGNE